jgi:hypothetical protein
VILPIRKCGVRVENGAGWAIRCIPCGRLVIIANGDVKVDAAYRCATCAPNASPLDAPETHPLDLARQCDAEARQSERSAAQARRMAEQQERDGMPVCAARNRRIAEQADVWATQLRTTADGWRKVSEERRTG